MRLAVLSDIHGNQLALEAVLDDLKRIGGADRTWILGDLVMAGPRPAECLRMIRELQAQSSQTVEVIGGNTDRYLAHVTERGLFPKDAVEWAAAPNLIRNSMASFIWTMERLTWNDALYLQGIIDCELALDVADYGRVIGFHGGPRDDEFGVWQDTPAEILLDKLSDREGRLAVCGHTHHILDRDLGTWHVVNVGSVGFPNVDTRATYALLTFENGNVEVNVRFVEYDREAVIRDLEVQNKPGRDWAIGVLRTGKYS